MVLVALSSTASSQSVSLSATSVSFGTEVAGATSAGKTVTLTNTGSATLAVSGVAASSPFSQTNTCGTVNAGAKCTIRITFSPIATGAATGAVTISDNAGDTPQTISLSGTGVLPVTLTPASISFAARTVGTTSPPVTATLTNYLSTTVTLSGIATSGDFAQTNTCTNPLPALSKCTISVTFTPTLTATRTGTLTVTDAASSSPQISTLSGTGNTIGLVSLVLAPSSLSLPAGGTQQFTAIATFSTGATYDLTQSATWRSSNLKAATVANTGTRGLATAVANGTATVTATLSPIVASATVTVAPALVSIAVTPANASIVQGATNRYTATGSYSDGSTQNLTSSVGWSSSATNVATIASGGLLTAVATGSSTITASSGTVSGSTPLTVKPPSLVSISVSPANASIAAGTTLQYAATGTFSDGSTRNLITNIVWSSSAPSVSTITAGGLATGAAVGTASITAKVGSISGSTGLTVTPATLVSIVVTPVMPLIALGMTQQFTATGRFTDNTTQDLTASVTWSSSATNVATIAPSGRATSVGPGTANISASKGSVNSGSVSLTVTQAVLVSIAVTPVFPSIGSGTTQQFTATGSYSDNSTQNLTGMATWQTDAASVATINSTGLATSIEVGTANITATQGGVIGSTTLTVSSAALVSIAVSPGDASLAAGTTQPFTATATYSDDSTQDVTGAVYWTSGTLGVATVSDAAGSQGTVTAVAPGTSVITATSGSVSGTGGVAVTAAVLVSLTITPQSSSIALGTSQQFTAMGTYSDNSTQDVTSTVVWASTQTGVAVVSNLAGSKGLATSAGLGTATINATLGMVNGSTMLTVISPSLVSIAVTPTIATIAVGSNQQFTATGTYTDGSKQNVTGAASWISTNTGAAIIGDAPGTQGVASALGIGTTTISATLGSSSGSATLNVAAAATDSLGTINATAIKCPNSGISGASCFTLPVANCVGVSDYTGYAKVLAPTGPSTGTVVLLNGGSGSGIWESYADTTDNIPVGINTINGLRALGVTTVEIAFGPPFVRAAGQAWETGPGGIRAAACRVATMTYWAWTNIHGSNPAKPFMTIADSAGSQAMGECLAHYGCGNFVQFAEEVSGPPFADMVRACIEGTSSRIPAPCGGGNVGYLVGVGNAEQFVDIAYPGPWCSSAQQTGATTNESSFIHDSIDSPDANFYYPSTHVHLLWGGEDLTSAQSGGLEFQNWLTAAGTTADHGCVPGSSHQVGAFPAGGQQIVDDIQAFLAGWQAPSADSKK